MLVYAQPARSARGLHTDYTFAVWRDDELVPAAKAYTGLDDAETRCSTRGSAATPPTSSALFAR